MKALTLSMACTAMLMLGSAATADVVSIMDDSANSTEALGNFMGSIQYDYLGLDMGLITVDLTNTSPLDNGGYLTGLMFNINSDDLGASAALTGGTHPFLDSPTHDGSPYGRFDAGAALGGDWQGGGDPVRGIGVGDSGTFTFDLTASDADSLTAMDFINGDSEYNFLVRFRGFDDDGSDKVPGMIVQIPTPGTLCLLGVAAFGARRRRRG